jgi:ABC-2 type transport system permease protein
MFSFCFFLSLLSAWIIKIYDIRFVLTQLLKILSGAIIPLWMWPDSIKNIALHSPFPYITSAPVAFLIKNSYEYPFIVVVVNEFIWLVLFSLVNVLLYYRFRRKLNIQGG